MASARSKRTYTIGWDGCGSLPFRNGHGITAGLDRHFKTNHRLAFPISVLSPQDRHIRETASFYNLLLSVVVILYIINYLLRESAFCNEY